MHNDSFKSANYSGMLIRDKDWVRSLAWAGFVSNFPPFSSMDELDGL